MLDLVPDGDDPGDLTRLSRVELEHLLVPLVERGTPESLAVAQAIRDELASRTWQHDNPYAPE